MSAALPEILKRIEDAADAANRNVRPALMAVSKFQPFEKMRELYDQGQRIFGENYVQELIDKKKQFEYVGIHDADLQFIGHLQTNKVKTLLPFVETIHSIDSFRLLDEVEKRAAQLQKKIRCYFQINIDQESSKGGFLETELPLLAEKASACQWLEPSGLMCIPDPEKDPQQSFLKMKEISDLYSAQVGSGLSMGMSDDYRQAIQCGSTVVRIGSALFGVRRS